MNLKQLDLLITKVIVRDQLDHNGEIEGGEREG